LFSCSELQCAYHLSVNGVLHIGAHELEERGSYIQSGWSPRTWIEANSVLVGRYSTIEGDADRIIEATCWSDDGELLDFNIMSNTECSSVLGPELTSAYYPDVVITRVVRVMSSRVDSLFKGRQMPNFVNIDVQGSELQVLQGFGERLLEVDYIYCEVNSRDLYRSCSRVEQIDELLRTFGFRRIATRWVPLRHWGDAFYARSECVETNVLGLFHLRLTSVWHYVYGFLTESYRSLVLMLKGLGSHFH